jgi:hypothetical protein
VSPIARVEEKAALLAHGVQSNRPAFTSGKPFRINGLGRATPFHSMKRWTWGQNRPPALGPTLQGIEK